MDSILVLMQHAYSGAGLTLVQAQRLYRFLPWALVGAVGIVIVGWVCNLVGWRGVSIVLSLVLTALTVTIWFEPKRLVVVAGAGAAAGAIPHTNGTATDGATEFVLFYVDLLGKVLLWGSVLLFVLGTIPFGENPFVIFSITAGLLLLVFINWQWKIGTTHGKRLFYWYVCAMMIVFIASLVPGAVWVKYMPYGWNPTEIGTTPTEDTLYAIKRAKMEKKEEAEDQILQRILKKIRASEATTPEEEAFLRQKDAQPKESKISQPEPLLTLTMPANGDSRQIAAEKGIVPSFTGYDFDTHCVYADGSDRSMLDKRNPCIAGNIIAYYVRNLSGKPNTVTYVLVKS